ncbi:TLC domain-containing protein 2-like [Anneissia japonica]|uniref:TLC domain-containing protein 2-like n=1 Tax=Anneissia japonica TaxID=1529436 RepID=UPI0014255307|nr:TLC domain-containing protein 2-like [Anneissia japonica]
MFDDLIYKHTAVCECLVAISIGYFVYDFIDNITYRRLAESWAILLHHVTFCCGVGVALAIQQYIGYSAVTLLAEVNSIFLHSRQIMLMMNISKSSMMYFVNNSFNIITFVLLRFGTSFWLTWWLYVNYVRMPTFLIAVAGFGLVVMHIVNFGLFSRLITSDLLSKQTSKSKKDHDEEPNDILLG